MMGLQDYMMRALREERHRALDWDVERVYLARLAWAGRPRVTVRSRIAAAVGLVATWFARGTDARRRGVGGDDPAVQVPRPSGAGYPRTVADFLGYAEVAENDEPENVA
jgi:hypothetical protein